MCLFRSNISSWNRIFSNSSQWAKNNEEMTHFPSIKYEHMNEQVDSLVIIMYLSS